MPPKELLTWDFPLARTHAGILLGNGRQGLMVWGTDRLCLTIGRAGFWDHRGGQAMAGTATFAEVRRHLEASDEAGLRSLFTQVEPHPDLPPASFQLGCGRFELRFPGGYRPRLGRLDTAHGELSVIVENSQGRQARVVISQAMDEEIIWVSWDAVLDPVAIGLKTAWQCVSKLLSGWGIKPPECWADDERAGFCQELPEDDPLTLACHKQGCELVIATALGPRSGEVATGTAASAIQRLGALRLARNAWWDAYWETMPTVEVPDPVIQHLWDYGTYKIAGLSSPYGPAAGLQGPWLEEYQLPPWSADYHFNINVQMIYEPCLATSRLSHFGPLWEMIQGWMPTLEAIGTRFFGAPGALMLPHAVDDRCQVVGTFWTGTIDHACVAWMAQMAWSHYRYSMDPAILAKVAWPLLVGAFNGFWAMVEEGPGNDGEVRLSLPVSVSPEYRADAMNAWGRDASFQLAAAHAIARILPRAAAVLGHPVDPRWDRLDRELPPYTLVGDESAPRIGLWAGQDLDESHRHHAHLGAIYPFGTIQPDDPAHRDVVKASLAHWVAKGAGAWSGWCVPWASILCSRCGRPDAAVAWLHWWSQVFTNEGHGTLHDAFFPGGSLLAAHASAAMVDEGNYEVMQMDAGMGAVTALTELLVQDRDDVLTVLPALPARWRELRFDGIRCPGAFLVGATVSEGRTTEVRVHSLHGGPLRLAHGLGEHWQLDIHPQQGRVLSCATEPGQQLRLRRRQQ